MKTQWVPYVPHTVELSPVTTTKTDRCWSEKHTNLVLRLSAPGWATAYLSRLHYRDAEECTDSRI